MSKSWTDLSDEDFEQVLDNLSDPEYGQLTDAEFFGALKAMDEADEIKLTAVVVLFRHPFRKLCRNKTKNFLSKQDDNQKRERLNEALVLQEELEQAVTSCPDAGAETKLRLLSFLRNEIEALQRELEASIPFISLHEESDVE